MLEFETVKWKNLLSTGNAFTEIPLNKAKTTLIVGKNGSGKSTILDALCFGLFGKPFRKINKPNLLNSQNDKNCLVEITFKQNGKSYKVSRGIKPNVFEIYQDGVLLNQDSASRDYQEYLEKSILRLSYKSFCQIVILGSASFVPFMQLSAADRRAIIEDLLDIQIFSVMGNIVKSRLQVNKETYEKNKIEFIGKQEKHKFILETITSLQRNNASVLNDLQNQIAYAEKNISIVESELVILDNDRKMLLDQTKDISKIRSKHTSLLKLQSQIGLKQKALQQEIDFFVANTECPTCQQSIEEEFRATKLEKYNTNVGKFKKGLEDIETQIHECLDMLSLHENTLKKIEGISLNIAGLQQKKAGFISTKNDLVNQVTALSSPGEVEQNILIEKADVEKELEDLTIERKRLLEDKTFIDTAINLLKDGGIKTKIIKQYLPIINKQINRYLAQMDFFVNFNINEQFEETIKSQYRDEFSYANFSEGEKTRIDLALLFTWRAIAKLKNSINTNLLILDEIFDGSLDTTGTDEFLKIMNSLGTGTNVIVISHKQDQMLDKFDTVHKFTKVRNFSVLDKP